MQVNHLPGWRQINQVLVLVLLIVISVALCPNAMAEEQDFRILRVTGNGTETVATSLTQVELGVEISGKTANAVQQEVAKRTNAVVEFLRSRNVEKLQTTGIRLQPNYDFSNNQRRLVGYIGVNTVSFRLDTQKVSNLLDRAVQAGATRIDRISFTATDMALAEAQTQALRQAVGEAQTQAEVVLQALNLSAKEIVRIEINRASVPLPKAIQAEALAQRADAVVSTPVIGGEQTVRASVTLQISY